MIWRIWRNTECTICLYSKTSDCQNKKCYGKKTRANNPRKNIALNTEKNAVFTSNDILSLLKRPSVYVNGRNISNGEKKKRKKKKRSVNPLIPVMKDVTHFRQKNKRKKSSSPESLHGNIVNLTTI
ncbi:hypothetical protein TNCV_2702381 [Trichonephila clavipes]|nr:hypothetical protein TNCV_2702381 [Trichonephila clavipes]